MEQNYTLPLSRWHKIAERLSREYTEAVACSAKSSVGINREAST